MSQVATPPVVSAPPSPVATPTPPSAPLAGKYADQAALEKGIREAWTKVGLPGLPAEGSPLIGQGAMFGSVDDAVAGYKKIERLIAPSANQPTPPATPPAPALPQIGEPASATDEDMTTVGLIQKAGLNGNDVMAQFGKDGKLTDEQYAAIRKAHPGVSKAMLNEHLALLHRDFSRTIAEVKSKASEMAGGEQKFQTLLAWAGSQYKGEELANMNRMLADPTTTVAAVKIMLHDYATSGGTTQTKPIIAGAPGAPTGKPANAAEMAALMARVQSGDPSAIATLNAMSAADFSIQ